MDQKTRKQVATLAADNKLEGRAQVAASLRAAAAVLEASGESLQAPQINNNGTSKKELMDQLLAVHHAGREMQKALSNAAPHARDYQTLKPSAYQAARKQHDDRADRLNSILKEIKELASAVQDQEHGRGRS